MEAIGGRTAVEGVKGVRFKLGGESWPRYQNVNAEPPFTLSSYEEETVLDLTQNRLAVEQKNKGAGFRGHSIPPRATWARTP